jgi:hypothetical protein
MALDPTTPKTELLTNQQYKQTVNLTMLKVVGDYMNILYLGKLQEKVRIIFQYEQIVLLSDLYVKMKRTKYIQ